MNWQLFGVSFVMVFLSELGDKSQLAAITLGGNSKSTLLAFFGVAGGLVFTSFLGVLLGDQLAQVLPTSVLKGVAAMGFALLGFYLLWQPAPGLEMPSATPTQPTPETQNPDSLEKFIP